MVPITFVIGHFVGVPEWSNGIGLGPIGLVPTRVQITSPTYISIIDIIHLVI